MGVLAKKKDVPSWFLFWVGTRWSNLQLRLDSESTASGLTVRLSDTDKLEEFSTVGRKLRSLWPRVRLV